MILLLTRTREGLLEYVKYDNNHDKLCQQVQASHVASTLYVVSLFITEQRALFSSFMLALIGCSVS